jgi:hypothetical protein
MDVEFLEEVQDHVEDCLQDWEMYPWVLVVFYSWYFSSCDWTFIRWIHELW